MAQPDFRAELERLVDLYEALGGNWSPHGYTDTWNDALASACAALATPPPEPPVDGEVVELVALIRQCALAWEPDARLLGNMTAAQLVRAAELLERTATPPPEPDIPPRPQPTGGRQIGPSF